MAKKIDEFVEDMNSLLVGSVSPSSLKGEDKEKLDTAIAMIKSGEYPWHEVGMKKRLWELLCKRTSLKCSAAKFREYVNKQVADG